ncbi:hypothetical protein Lal_00049753 [Lupinus albus]|nr:hypothetical protein Lal_00049753 [Lupinus albus]
MASKLDHWRWRRTIHGSFQKMSPSLESPFLAERLVKLLRWLITKSPEVGSSRINTLGSCMTSTPIETLRFSPPDIPLILSSPILVPATWSSPSSLISDLTLEHSCSCGSFSFSFALNIMNVICDNELLRRKVLLDPPISYEFGKN